MGQKPRRRVALVTGGAVGLGRAISVRLAADGAAVAIGYHASPPDEAIAEIESRGGEALAVPLDITDRRRVDEAVADLVAHFGRLDILVNNAGGLLARMTIDEMDDDHWHRVLQLNLTGAFYCTRAAAPHLGPGGRIVNVSSMAAQNGGGPGAAAYAAAKAGLIGFTRASAKGARREGRHRQCDHPRLHRRHGIPRNVFFGRGAAIDGRSDCPRSSGRARRCGGRRRVSGLA